MSNTVECNMCMWVGNGEDLVLFKDKNSVETGCPKCETDAYLINLGVA